MNEWIKKQMEIFPPGRDWELQVLGMEEGRMASVLGMEEGKDCHRFKGGRAGWPGWVCYFERLFPLILGNDARFLLIPMGLFAEEEADPRAVRMKGPSQNCLKLLPGRTCLIRMPDVRSIFIWSWQIQLLWLIKQESPTSVSSPLLTFHRCPLGNPQRGRLCSGH